ncbi:cytochrome-c oxidase, cbb3-type subunit III [Peteryoungia algae]|uniref:Cbb3-type cytochrome c oxidase subunit n=1 Tax=Peteryoungia algae TaxID=2919917 RepID=A0ABT0D5I0_9HYPH|nr:cytochrome-c oxidase, cbb3-type subunit III [Rhizobium sp. SSM4.3]MCJ8240670.1 cytochrome-c oxidase, cbb3-type subunit III [Rhizobium sp. SSM4.3]
MEVEIDPVSKRKTTGHVWNGIKELDTPIPKGILLFLIITHIFAVVWWMLLPTWPLGDTYTKGLLGVDQKEEVAEVLQNAALSRSSWAASIAELSFDEIRADEKLMATAETAGHQLFGDNCAACHRRDGKGGPNYPDLTDDDWIWGGTPEMIQQTLTVGINSRHLDTRVSQMPAFGRDEMLDREQVRDVAAFVQTMSDPRTATDDNNEQVVRGREVFQSNCATCHGSEGRGDPEVGAPNLADDRWIYGGSLRTIIDTIHGGRAGHMPTWDERLSPVEIKVLALYVFALSQTEP